MYSSTAKSIKKTALSRIRRLFEQAELRFSSDPALSNRYVQLARKIAQKAEVRIPPELKLRFCKKCHSYLVQGVNCKVRLSSHSVLYTCLICGNTMRHPYIREKKLRRLKAG